MVREGREVREAPAAGQEAEEVTAEVGVLGETRPGAASGTTFLRHRALRLPSAGNRAKLIDLARLQLCNPVGTRATTSGDKFGLESSGYTPTGRVAITKERVMYGNIKLQKLSRDEQWFIWSRCLAFFLVEGAIGAGIVFGSVRYPQSDSIRISAETACGAFPVAALVCYIWCVNQIATRRYKATVQDAARQQEGSSPSRGDMSEPSPE